MIKKYKKKILENNTTFQKLSRPQVYAMEHKELIDSIMKQTPTPARIGDQPYIWHLRASQLKQGPDQVREAGQDRKDGQWPKTYN